MDCSPCIYKSLRGGEGCDGKQIGQGRGEFITQVPRRVQPDQVGLWYDGVPFSEVIQKYGMYQAHIKISCDY